MKVLLILPFIALISGCGDVTPSPPSQIRNITPSFVDKENGVLCYQVFQNNQVLSCVKVTDTSSNL